MKAAIWVLNIILGVLVITTIAGWIMGYKIMKDPVGWTNKFLNMTDTMTY
jgi:hypothetical protein